MSLFRSEEHLDNWLRANKREQGAVTSLDTLWCLAKAWYVVPRLPDWKPSARDASQAVINSVGLTGEFWTLP